VQFRQFEKSNITKLISERRPTSENIFTTSYSVSINMTEYLCLHCGVDMKTSQATRCRYCKMHPFIPSDDDEEDSDAVQFIRTKPKIILKKSKSK
jgi:hypothetical protein